VLILEGMTTKRNLLSHMGRRIRLLRENAGLTQGELAEAVTRLGVDVRNSQISAIERGTASPSWQVAVAIADVLYASLDYIAVRSEFPDVADDNLLPPAAEVGISPEAEEIARIVDDLPPFQRDALLAHARILEAMERESERNITAALDEFQERLRVNGSIIGDAGMATIRAALIDYTAGLLGASAMDGIDAMAADSAVHRGAKALAK
jgi:transcriptional regulator with XRE-family HTH domain